jgi:hypothetical protein
MVREPEKSVAAWREISRAFRLVGHLKAENGCLKWDSAGAGTHSSVYVMVLKAPDGELMDVLYVGMATKGWAGRARDHNNGLSNIFGKLQRGECDNKAWKEHYEDRLGWLGSLHRIEVHECVAPVISCSWGAAPAHHALEKIVTEKLDPRYNRLRRGAGSPASAPRAVVLAFEPSHES